MKNIFGNLFLTSILALSNVLAIQAQGAPAFVSNHQLTGTWTTKSSREDKSRKPTVILKLDLCGNGDTLVGTVEQIKLIDAPRKLNVESATITRIEVPPESLGLTEYTILLNSLKDSDIAVTMISTLTDVAGQMGVNFDNGDTSYTAKRKQTKASGRCLDLLNQQLNQQEDESDD